MCVCVFVSECVCVCVSVCIYIRAAPSVRCICTGRVGDGILRLSENVSVAWMLIRFHTDSALSEVFLDII